MDDESGKTTGLVRVYEQGGKLFARIEQVLKVADAKRLCHKCSDERRNQPITGLVIMRNMTLADDEYIGGDILDPKNGQVYRCRLRVKEGGKKLEMRGFVGVTLFGRTQIWERAGT